MRRSNWFTCLAIHRRTQCWVDWYMRVLQAPFPTKGANFCPKCIRIYFKSNRTIRLRENRQCSWMQVENNRTNTRSFSSMSFTDSLSILIANFHILSLLHAQGFVRSRFLDLLSFPNNFWRDLKVFRGGGGENGEIWRSHKDVFSSYKYESNFIPAITLWWQFLIFRLLKL